ncbi:MAG: hypothetical protein ACFFD1_06670 [Candidatus Thorarchaeota archaeon]
MNKLNFYNKNNQRIFELLHKLKRSQEEINMIKVNIR